MMSECYKVWFPDTDAGRPHLVYSEDSTVPRNGCFAVGATAASSDEAASLAVQNDFDKDPFEYPPLIRDIVVESPGGARTNHYVEMEIVPPNFIGHTQKDGT
jgi:hypothetical protein